MSKRSGRAVRAYRVNKPANEWPYKASLSKVAALKTSFCTHGRSAVSMKEIRPSALEGTPGIVGAGQVGQTGGCRSL